MRINLEINFVTNARYIDKIEGGENTHDFGYGSLLM